MNTVYLLMTKPTVKLQNVHALGSIPAVQTSVKIPAVQNTQNIPAPQVLENIRAASNSLEPINREKRPDPSEYPGKIIWNVDMEADLIKLMKKEDALWNTKSEKFKGRRHKMRSLNRVMKEMKVLWPSRAPFLTYPNCFNKIKNLRTYYKRERIRMQDKSYVDQWIHYNDLNFLNLDETPSIKEEPNDVSYSPTIIPFPSDVDSSQDIVEEDIDASKMLEEETAEDGLSLENQNKVASSPDCQTNSSMEEKAPTAKKKDAVNTNGLGKVPHRFQSSFKRKVSLTKNSKKSFARVIKVEPNFISREKSSEMSHDEAFGNFIANDMAKIPEGKQKEQLRFQIIEMIHRVKMNEDLMFE